MPNHCMNILEVYGPQEIMDRMIKQVQGKEESLACEKIIPMPKSLSNNPAPINNNKLKQEHIDKYGYPDWYHWAIDRWGSKWGCYDCSRWKKYGEGWIINFQSAWSPPSPAIKELAIQYPALRFNLIFFEPGCGFAGKEKYEDGECIESFTTEDDNEVYDIAQIYFGQE